METFIWLLGIFLILLIIIIAKSISQGNQLKKPNKESWQKMVKRRSEE